MVVRTFATLFVCTGRKLDSAVKIWRNYLLTEKWLINHVAHWHESPGWNFCDTNQTKSTISSANKTIKRKCEIGKTGHDIKGNGLSPDRPNLSVACQSSLLCHIFPQLLDYGLALTAKRPISYGRRNYEISMINEQRPSVMMYILIYFKQDIQIHATKQRLRSPGKYSCNMMMPLWSNIRWFTFD